MLRNVLCRFNVWIVSTALLAPLSLSGCLNSSVKNNQAAGPAGSGAEIMAVSPTKVILSWPDVTGAERFDLYRRDVADPIGNVPAGTGATFKPSKTVDVLAGFPDQITVFALYDNDDRSKRAHRIFSFTSWTGFDSATFSAAARPYTGIQVDWTYTPWSKLPAAKSFEGKNAQKDAILRCYFLENGTATSDPFVAGAKIIEAPLDEGTLQAGTEVNSLTPYTVGCEAVYIDGTVSRNTRTINLLSSEELSEDRDNAFLDIAPIQVSRAISFRANKASNGLLSLDILAMRKDGSSAGKVFGLARSNLSADGELLSLDGPFPNFGQGIYGGKHRISGSFTSNETGLSKALAPKDFYVKSADNVDEILYPSINNIAGAHAMGSAVASGDFDCDGIDDLAVGLPAVGWKSDDGSFYKSGVVVVYYGTSNGLYYSAVAPSRNPAAPTASGRPPVIITPQVVGTSPILGTDSNNALSQIRFGHALTVGNFNRDFHATTSNILKGHECMDLAIGAPGEYSYASGSGDNPVFESAGGSIYVKYGAPDGLKNSGFANFTKAYSVTDGSCSPGSPSNSSFHPSNSASNADTALWPNYNYPNNCPGSRIYPFRLRADEATKCIGSAGRVPCTVPAYDADTMPTPHSRSLDFYRTLENYPFLAQGGWTLPSTNTGDLGGYGSQFGSAIATGDWNNDGFDDLIVGAPRADLMYPATAAALNPTVHTAAGAAFVYFGNLNGIYTNYRKKRDVASDDLDGPSAIAGDGGPYNAYSPIKIVAHFSRRASNAHLGSSVGIAMLYEGDSSGTLESANSGKAAALVGAPNMDGNRGAVAVKVFPNPANGTQNSTIPASFQIGRPSGSPHAFLANDILWGESPGSLYGSAIAVGNFRDPRLGRPNPNTETSKTLIDGASIGLIPKTRRPFREAFAVGAPGYNGGQGRVYVWSVDSLGLETPANAENNLMANPSGIGSDLFVSREGLTLCSTPSDCPGAILDKPTEIASNFGASLGRVAAPREVTNDCTTSTNCKGAYDNSGSINARWQPLYSLNLMDALLVGAPGSSDGGGAVLYSAAKASGLSSQGGSPLYPPFKIAGDRYGHALTGGYFSGEINDFHVAVGAPNQSYFGRSVAERSTRILGGGSAFLFSPPQGGGAMIRTSTVDLALESKDPGGADFLNISVIGSSGYSNSRHVGDLNCDGYSDIAIPHSISNGSSSRTVLLILYGSESGLVRTLANGQSAIPSDFSAPRKLFELGGKAPQWLDTSLWAITDPNPLTYFEGIGSVNDDQCDDLLVANQQLIVIHGSDSGLVLDSPQENPTGKNPKVVKFPNIASKIDTTNWQAFVSANGSIASPPLVTSTDDLGVRPTPGQAGVFPLLQPTLAEWRRLNADLPGAREPICHGDFNGDGFGDMAVGSVSIAGGVRGLGPSDNELPAGTDQLFNVNYGSGERVVNSQIFVFYGSPNGLQTSFSSASYPEVPDTSTPVSRSLFESTCSQKPSNPLIAATCRPALLFDPDQFIATTSSSSGRYEPYRVWRDSQLRSTNANLSRIHERFGEACVSAGDLDGDGFDDLVIPLPRSTSRKGSFVLFRGSCMGLRNSDNIDSPQCRAAEIARVVKVEMNPSQVGGTSTTTTELEDGALGSSYAGLGDMNGDGLADFALGVPRLRAPSGGTTNNGGVMLFYGRSSLVGAGDSGPVSPRSPSMAKTRVYQLCDKPGLSCADTQNNKLGHLIRPDSFDSSNRGLRFGSRVTGAGDVNGDGFGELLVSMPEFSPPGLSQTGGAFVYFGRSFTAGDVDAGWPVPGTSQDPWTDWVAANPNEAANCDQFGRCRPMIIVPEFVSNAFNPNGQRWLATSQLVIRNFGGIKRYNFANFGSRATQSQDVTLKTNDIILMPQFKFNRPQEVGYPEFDHLGGVTLWY